MTQSQQPDNSIPETEVKSQLPPPIPATEVKSQSPMPIPATEVRSQLPQPIPATEVRLQMPSSIPTTEVQAQIPPNPVQKVTEEPEAGGTAGNGGLGNSGTKRPEIPEEPIPKKSKRLAPWQVHLARFQIICLIILAGVLVIGVPIAIIRHIYDANNPPPPVAPNSHGTSLAPKQQ